MTEKEKFFEKLAEKRKNGLIDIKFTPNWDNFNGNISEEALYAELNRMDEVKTEPDDELFLDIPFHDGYRF